MGRAGAKASKNVRSTSIFKSINLLGIEAGSRSRSRIRSRIRSRRNRNSSF